MIIHKTSEALKKEKEKHQWAIERNELAKVEKQLEELGLVVKDVKGDGNCLFRYSSMEQSLQLSSLHLFILLVLFFLLLFF